MWAANVAPKIASNGSLGGTVEALNRVVGFTRLWSTHYYRNCLPSFVARSFPCEEIRGQGMGRLSFVLLIVTGLALTAYFGAAAWRVSGDSDAIAARRIAPT